MRSGMLYSRWRPPRQLRVHRFGLRGVLRARVGQCYIYLASKTLGRLPRKSTAVTALYKPQRVKIYQIEKRQTRQEKSTHPPTTRR